MLRLILLITAAAFQSALALCPAGYTYGPQSKSCFLAVKQTLTRSAAAAKCALTPGGHLVYLESAVKHTEMTNYFTLVFPDTVLTAAYITWTGGCRVNASTFVWSEQCSQSGPPASATKTPMSYTNWSPGQPDSSITLTEWCVDLYTGSSTLRWNDRSCGDEIPYYICETSPMPDISACDPNPCANGGGCVKTGETSFTCVCAAGWTGQRCETVYDPCNASPCLHDGRCNKTGPTSYVCACNSGWTGFNCETLLTLCPAGYTYGHQSRSCFLAVKQTLTRSAAAAKCALTPGGHLVYLESAVKHTEMTNYFNLVFPDTVSTSAYITWTGGCRVNASTFVWSEQCSLSGPPANATKTPMSYTNWSPGQPDSNTALTEWCVDLYSGSSTLRWNDRTCADAIPYYICETSPMPDINSA